MRALSPHIGAQIEIDRKVFKVWRARETAESAHGLESRDGRLLLGCGKGTLELLELQPPSKARMTAADFLRGWRGTLELTSS